MGNTISYSDNSSAHQAVYGYDSTGVISEHQGNLLRKHIHETLMNRKEVINGSLIDINKMKVFCRKTRAGKTNGPLEGSAENPHADSLKALGRNDFISIALPYVSNEAPSFNSKMSQEGYDKQLNIRSKVKTKYVPFNYSGSEEERVQYMSSDGTIKNMSNEKCDIFMEEICGRQVFDNQCVVKTEDETVGGSFNYILDTDKSRCLKEKTHEGQLTEGNTANGSRTYNVQEVRNILRNVNDIKLDRFANKSREQNFI